MHAQHSSTAAAHTGRFPVQSGLHATKRWQVAGLEILANHAIGVEYRWHGGGGTDRSYLNDFVDAIEIQNLALKINYQSCVTPAYPQAAGS